MKLFMIDIESTGVNQDSDDIIEIGIVEMKQNDRGYYYAGEQFHQILHTSKKPESKFAKEHMVELYNKANKAERYNSFEMRADIVRFLKSCGATGAKDTQFCGWNCSTFDLPFMVKKGYLRPSSYDKNDNQVGDFHYRPYELSGMIEGLSDILGYSRKTIIRLADELKEPLKIGLPDGKEHDAIFDCYKQINMLNGLIGVGRKAGLLRNLR